jgi:hypothetical protein
LAPFAGVIVTRGAATAPLDVVPAPLPAVAVWFAALTWVVPGPPPEHPAATSASAVTAATPATRRMVIVSAARIPAPFPRTTFCIRYREGETEAELDAIRAERDQRNADAR